MGEDFGCLGWIHDKKQKGGDVFFVTFCLFEDTFKFWWNFWGIFVREIVLAVA